MEKIFRDKKAIFIFIFPAFIIFVVIVILPILLSAYYSFYNWNGIGEKVFIGIENYKNLFIGNQDGFTRSVLNSLILAILSVFIQLPIALFIALILAKGIKGEKIFRTIYFFPVLISSVVIGQLWMKIYHPNFGVLNTFLRNTGLGSLSREWLGDTKTALIAVFIPILWQYVGYHMLLMYMAVKSVPEEIYEVAKIDGASEFMIMRKITIPLIKPILKVCAIFAITGSFKSFDMIYILTNGGPLHSSEVPSTLMYSTIFNKYMYGYGSAMAIFIILECFIVTVIIQKLFENDVYV